MSAAQTVQLSYDLGNLHGFSVEGFRHAGLKGHCDLDRLIRRFLRSHAQYKKLIIIGLAGRIFQFETFVADMPEITVAAVPLSHGKRKINAMVTAVLHFLFTGIHFPHFGHAPGGDDLQVRCKGLYAQLKPDLVVALSGGAMTDGRGVFFAGDFHKPLCNGRTRHGGAEQIFVFINGTRLDTGHNKIVAEFICDIFYI